MSRDELLALFTIILGYVAAGLMLVDTILGLFGIHIPVIGFVASLMCFALACLMMYFVKLDPYYFKNIPTLLIILMFIFLGIFWLFIYLMEVV